MDEQKTQIDINKYLKPILRRKWFVIIPVITFIIASTLIALRLPNIYESKCVLVVKQSRGIMNVVAGRDTKIDAPNILQAVREKMLSWNSVTKIIKSVGLNKTIKDEEDESVTMEMAYRSLLKKIDLKTRGKDHIMVSYQGTDPVKNFKIVDGLVSNFMEISKKAARTEADETLSFIEEDLVRLKQHLDESERSFRAFEEQHIEELSGTENSILPQLFATKASLVEVNREILALKEELKFLRKEKTKESKTVTGEIVKVPNPKLNELHKMANDLEIEITVLRARYFDEHPAIKKKQDEIARINEMIQKESAKVVSQEKIINNPMYESMIEKEFTLTLKLKSLQSRRKEIQSEIEAFKPTIENIPELKQEIYALKSAYDVNKKLYEERLVQKSQAELVKKLSNETKNDPFQIVEPARISYKPLKDQKVKVIAAGIVLGFGLGVGLVFGLEMIDPRFMNSEDIETFLDLPVLGMIPSITSKADVVDVKSG